MSDKNKYTINWKGLANGEHEFRFDAHDDLLRDEPELGINGLNANITVKMRKSATLLHLEILITGTVSVACDRCLEDLPMPVDFGDTIEVKFSDEDLPFDGQVMWINPAEGVLDLRDYFYESILLSLPSRRVHLDDKKGNPTCDPEMLSRFSIVSEEEFERLSGEVESSLDEKQLQKLEALKNKLEK